MRYVLVLILAIAFANVSRAENSQEASESSWQAIVSFCEGDATLKRNGQAFQIVRGAGIEFNDLFELSDKAQISVTSFNGTHFTIVGPGRLSLRGDQTMSQLHVHSGEIRVVHDGMTPLNILTADARYALGRGIMRLKKTSQQTTAELDAGAAATITDSGSLLPLPRRKAVATNEQGEMQVEQVGWAINPAAVRLASALQSAPQLTLPNAGIAQQSPTLPGQVPSLQNPAQPLNNNQPQTPQLPSQNQQAQLADDEEEPRLGQSPGLGGTTRGGDSGLAASQGLGLPSFSGSSSLGLGSFSGSSGSFSSGGLFADAGQQTFQGKVTPGNPNYAEGTPFAGSIHLVTAEQQYSLNNVQLNAAEKAAIGPQSYYSIGTGAAPTGQVVTDAQTGTSPVPSTLSVTRFDAHVVKLDQFGVPDPASDPAGLDSNIGITGLAGAEPTGPAVVGTAPLVDKRAKFNGNATFALGEFRVAVGVDGKPTFSIRRSDQDRLIVKDINGNDAEDLVTPNTDVTFEDTVDTRFTPQSPTVKTPVANGALDKRGTTYSELNFMRRSAFTNVVADTLQDYSRRTGQTRFVVDGKIVDISGYQPGQ